MKVLEALEHNLNSVILGKDTIIQKVMVGLLSDGHILLEDLPGTGKTTLAKAVAKSFEIDFKRIQCTPDILPSDITGITIFDLEEKTFKIRFGPVFTNSLLVDEVNRATPKSQSALLEAMAEYSVTIDGNRYDLKRPFMVIATQNPIEYEGTFPLPEAQLDRFIMKFAIGYPSKDAEVLMLQEEKERELVDGITPIATTQDLLKLQKDTRRVFVHPKISEYIIDLVNISRIHRDVNVGLSPRASIHLMRVSQGYALLNGRNFVIPDDVKSAFPDVANHRLLLKADAKLRGVNAFEVLGDILESAKVPSDIDFKDEIS